MLLPPRQASAEGEAVNGYPNWAERVLLEWMNRARSDPQADLAGCPSGNCKEAAYHVCIAEWGTLSRERHVPAYPKRCGAV